jgi:hypothetical protein
MGELSANGYTHRAASSEGAPGWLWPAPSVHSLTESLSHRSDLAITLLRATRYDEALASARDACAMAGQEAKAREILHELERRAASGYVSPYHLAYVYTGLGEQERPLDWLARAVAQRTGAAYGIKGSFLFTRLHGHPRFQPLLRGMKLA